MGIHFVEINGNAHRDQVISSDAGAGPVEGFEHGRSGELGVGIATAYKDQLESFYNAEVLYY